MMTRLRCYAIAATAAAVTSTATAFVPVGGVRLATYQRSELALSHGARRSRAGVTPTTTTMAIRAVESFNGAFTLEEKTAATLDGYLRHKDMIAEVCKQFDCTGAEYIGEIFQPVPYSSATPQGMPADIEQKYFLKENYGIANIPPVVMFNAKIFKPSRLCAIYKLDGMSIAAKEALKERQQRVRENEKHKKEEALLESEWDDLGSAIKEVYNMPVGRDDEEVDLDSMVV